MSDDVEVTIKKSINHELLQKACFNVIHTQYELLSQLDTNKSREMFIRSDKSSHCLSFLSLMFNESASAKCYSEVIDKMYSGSKELELRNRKFQNELLRKYGSLLIRGVTVWDSAEFCEFYIPDFESKLEEFFKEGNGEISNEKRAKIRSAVIHNKKYRPNSQ